MKRYWTGLVALILAVSASAAESAVKVEVTGNRVSLRAAPKLNSVLIDRVMEGDSLILLNDSNAEWLGVFPPDSVDLWVHNEFIRDNKVIPEKLNVRSGPSLSHSVVGVMDRGQAVTLRGEAGGWLRIAPPKGSIVWISRDYVEIPRAVKLPEAGNQLAPDPDKKQGGEIIISGILRPAGGVLYKLVNPDAEGIVGYYVRGNEQQMNELKGEALTIMGRTYWALDLDMPVIVPVKIQPSL